MATPRPSHRAAADAVHPGPDEDTLGVGEWPVPAELVPPPPLERPRQERLVRPRRRRRLPMPAPAAAGAAGALVVLALVATGLLLLTDRKPPSSTPPPRADARANAASTLPSAHVSTAPRRQDATATHARSVEVPDVRGSAVETATARLRAAGFVPAIGIVAAGGRPGTVVRQEPPGGTGTVARATVRLLVATPPPEAKAKQTSKPGQHERKKRKPAGPPKVVVPALVGSTLDAARASLAALGLHADVSETASTQPAGTVLAQSVVAGAQARAGMAVALRVSSGPAGVLVPDVGGLDEASAEARLEAAGLHADVVDAATSDAAEDGIVLDQSPAGGTRADRGSTVTIRVGRLESG